MNRFVKSIMIQMGYNPVAERFAFHYQNSDSENEWIRRPQGWYHEVDVVGFTKKRGLDNIEKKFKVLVWIDGEIHDTKMQQNKDETSMQMIREYYLAHPEKGEYEFVRIKKAVVMDAMKSGDHDSLCLKLFVNIPGSGLHFLPHMDRELEEEKVKDDDYGPEPSVDEQKEWQDLEGIEQEIYPQDD